MNISRIVVRQAYRINLLRSFSCFENENVCIHAKRLQYIKTKVIENVTQHVNGACVCRNYCTTTIVAGDGGTVRGSKRRLEVDYDELKNLLQTNSVLLFDVREPQELEKEGKISQAINIPLCQLKRTLQMTEDVFRSTFGIQKPSSKDNVVFYGLKSIKGVTASEIAHKLGFKKVKHYPGGYEEWKSKETEQHSN